ncbi:MAG: ATP-binding protein [Cyanobacteria bacterium]|nr:ATP-binding protein [Cyanobacteriota bacterium]
MDETCRICIVEDSETDRVTYRRWLTRQDNRTYQIFDCEDIASALDLCSSQQLDAIVLDYQLPDGSGLDFLHDLQKLTLVPPPATIVMTGQGSEAIAVAAIKAGAQDYLVKGNVTAERLAHVLDRAIASQRLQYKFQQQQQLQQLIADTALNIRNSLVLSDILREAVHAVCQVIAIDRVFIYRFDADMGGQVVAEALDGPWPSALHQRIDDTCFRDNGPEAYLSGRIVAIDDIYAADLTPCHRNMLQGFGVRANLVIPILLDAPIQPPDRATWEDMDKPLNTLLWGLLGIHACRGPRQWAAFECNLLRQLSIQLAIAIQQAELYDRLTAANHRLEQQVWERTQKLQAANQQLQQEIEQRDFAQAGVAAREQLLQDFFTAATQAGIGMAIHDREGHFLNLNCTMAEVHGCGPSALVGRSLREVRPDLADPLAAIFEQVVTEQASVSGIALRSLGRDGAAEGDRSRDWIASYFPVCDRRGEPQHVGAIVVEVTELRRSQDQLNHLSAALARSNSELEQFTQVVSADLQTVLATVQSFTALMAQRHRPQGDEGTDRYVHSITDGLGRIQDTIADLLTYSRIGPPNPTTIAAPAPLDGLVATVLEGLGDRAAAARLEVDPLPQVFAPVEYLERLFRNLLDNALRYRREEQPHLRVRHLPPLEDGPTHHCHLAIVDNGRGIAPQDHDRAFRLFQRLPSPPEAPRGTVPSAAAPRDRACTGMGLAICKKIVESLGGRIWIESEPGRSAAFHFTLPLAPPEPASPSVEGSNLVAN